MGTLSTGRVKTIASVDVTKTVGVGQDFETLQEAMDYTLTYKKSSFRFILHEDVECTVNTTQTYENSYAFDSDDGVTIRVMSFLGTTSGAYVNFRGYFTTSPFVKLLPSTGNCFMQFSFSTVNLYGDMGNTALIPIGNSTVHLSGVNVVDGEGCVIWAYNQSYVGLYDCVMYNTAISMSSLARCYSSSCTLGGVDDLNVWSGALLESNNYGGEFSIRNLTIQYASEGANLTEGATMIGAERIVFTNVTTPFNIPTNEIQPDGTLIKDGTTPIIAKDTVAFLSTDETKLDNITITGAVDLDTLSTDSHTHTNGTVLDNTTASFLVADEVKLDKVESVTALVDGLTVAVDMSTASQFSLTTTQNFTLSNPTGLVAGQTGFITVTQDITGSRLLTLDTNYKTVGGAGITLTTAPNAVDVLKYEVISATLILIRIYADVK